MRTKTGLSTEAVYIFHNMVRKLMTSFKPDYVAAIFESSEPTFRAESFAEYKANRTEMPHDLTGSWGVFVYEFYDGFGNVLILEINFMLEAEELRFLKGRCLFRLVKIVRHYNRNPSDSNVC